MKDDLQGFLIGLFLTVATIILAVIIAVNLLQ